MTAIVAAAGGVFAVADQDYLLQARQMQALSLAVHIPLVCPACSQHSPAPLR